jgi:hypothetical protein
MKMIQLVGQGVGHIVDLPFNVAQSCEAAGTAVPQEKAETIRVRGLRIDVEKAKTAAVGEDVRMSPDEQSAGAVTPIADRDSDLPAWPEIEGFDWGAEPHDSLLIRNGDVGEGKRPFVIGEWPSVTSFDVDLLRPQKDFPEMLLLGGSIVSILVENGFAVYVIRGQFEGYVVADLRCGHIFEPDDGEIGNQADPPAGPEEKPSSDGADGSKSDQADPGDVTSGKGEIVVPENWMNMRRVNRMALAGEIKGSVVSEIEEANKIIQDYLSGQAVPD